MAGLFVLFAGLGVLLFVVGAAVQNRWFMPRVSFHTHIVHGEGLREGSPVLLSGLEVGEVGEMSIMPDNRVDVEILVLEKHAQRLRDGTVANIRRLIGIGEKRIHLISEGNKGQPLPPGAFLPAREPTEILDVVANLDLGQYLSTLNRAVSAMEVVLTKLEEEDRLERMMEAFDEMGPTMKRMNSFFTGIEEPMVSLLTHKSFQGAFSGADRLFNDKNTRKMVRGMAKTFDEEKLQEMLARTDKLIISLDTMMAPDGNFAGTLDGLNKLVNDGRVDKILTSVERLSDSEKIEKLVENMAVLTKQMRIIAPEIPNLTKEMLTTLQEAVVVLKALQKSWLLDDETEEVRKELKKKNRQ